MKHISILSLLFISHSLLAQLNTFKFPQSSSTIQDFVPKDYFIKDSVQDDFNQDGLNDIVLVLAPKTELSQDFSNETNRTLLILQKTSIVTNCPPIQRTVFFVKIVVAFLAIRLIIFP
jgi:hypothetical protein